MSKLSEEYERSEGKPSHICDDIGMPTSDFVAWVERRAERWEAVAGKLDEACEEIRNDLRIDKCLMTQSLWKTHVKILTEALAEHEAAKGGSK